VHLTDWPDADDLPADADLVRDMDRVREVASVGLALRADRSLRVRLPLQTLTVAGRESERLAPFVDLIRDEVNVKDVSFTDDLEAFGSFALKPNGKVLGPKLGGDTKKVMQAARDGDWSHQAEGRVSVGGHTLEPGEFDLALSADEGSAAAPLRANDTVVALDIDVTPALAAEGTARDLIRLVQQARKDRDLQVSDRIALRLQLPDPVLEAVRTHEPALAEAVLASSIDYADAPLDETATLDGHPVTFDFAVA
jgi:isoleucyl-tRNA synthetase